MDIDKLIRILLEVSFSDGFGSLMDIDKLILYRDVLQAL